MDTDLSLISPAWTQAGAGLHLRSDHPCTHPTSPRVLRDHPGRLAAVEVTEDQVTLAVDRLRSWPLFWAVEDAGFTGYIIASSIGFSLYYTLPANSTQCQAGKVESYDYVKEGGKYYNVSNGQKVPLPFSFSNNNQTLTLSLGGTTMFFQKQ